MRQQTNDTTEDRHGRIRDTKHGEYQQKVSHEDVLDAIRSSEHPVTTQADVAKELDVSRATIHQRVKELVSNGDVCEYTVGSRAKVIYPNDNGGDIILLPNRREIAVTDDVSEKTRQELSRVSHLVDSSESGYLYKISDVDVWNSPHDEVTEYISELENVVEGHGTITESMRDKIKSYWESANTFTLRTHDDGYTILETKTTDDMENIAKRHLEFNDHYVEYISDTEMRIKSGAEADVKTELYDNGYPPIDKRRLDDGESLNIELQNITLRSYQQDWIDNFKQRGSGTYVGPSGSGKTIAAIGTMETVGSETLIIAPSKELGKQWKRELLDVTNLSEYQIGQYHGDTKKIRPVTIATYDIARMSRHRKIFDERKWGLMIADECHHLPSPVWKRVAGIQSVHRLGLTATPVRHDGSSKEIYTLIGPPVGTDWGKLFDDDIVSKPDVKILTVPWETNDHRNKYQQSSGVNKRIKAAMNPKKKGVIENILNEHSDQNVILFTEWIDQGKEYEKEFNIPFIYGETKHKRREEVFEQMRNGNRSKIIMSRIGDEGIDIPNIEVCIIASTIGGSSTQTAQRIGRSMRPVGASKGYLIATEGSNEYDFVRESTNYLSEKGINVTSVESIS